MGEVLGDDTGDPLGLLLGVGLGVAFALATGVAEVDATKEADGLEILLGSGVTNTTRTCASPSGSGETVELLFMMNKPPMIPMTISNTINPTTMNLFLLVGWVSSISFSIIHYQNK